MLGAAPVQTAAGGFSAAAGATGAATSLTSQQVMSELFPNGFTQEGMTKLLALKNSGKVTADVYYQVVSQAATSSTPATQSLAVTALEAVPGAEAFTILATMLEKSPSSTVSSQVNAALTQYQSTQMLSYLATPLASTDSTIRYQALLQLNAGAQAVLSQLTSIATSSASNPTRTTASANVQSFFSSYVILLQQLEKTETNQQNMQEETTTLAAINQLMGTASAVQAFARR